MLTERDYRLRDSVALLPTRTNINFATMRDNPYYEEGMVYLVLGDLHGKPRRIISGSGSHPYRGFETGTQHRFHHDQQFYDFGYLRVVGWFNGLGDASGNVPNQKLPLGVFK